MSKLFIIAKAEYLASIKSKAFIIGIIMVPVMMGLSIGVQIFLKDKGDKSDIHVAIVDRTGFLYPHIEEKNNYRSQHAIYSTSEDGSQKQTKAKFILESYPETEPTQTSEIDLSKRVESGELLAYVILGKNILETDTSKNSDQPRFAYHTKSPALRDLPNWLRYAVNESIKKKRFENSNLDQAEAQELLKQVNLTEMGLVAHSNDGSTEKAEKIDMKKTMIVPVASGFLMLLFVMMTAPTLLNQVLEEKIQKISEVLISSVSPFQLLMGKLVGTIAVALSLAAFYLIGIYCTTLYYGVSDLVPVKTYFWFFPMLILAMFMYGSIFSAIGAACNEIKDAQSMITPAMLIMMIPLFLAGPIIQSPNSTLSAAVSMFPTATPMIMTIRMGLPPGPPTWQIVVSVFLTIGFTIVCVAAAAKIFRIGILSQGQTPTIPKLIKWLFTK